MLGDINQLDIYAGLFGEYVAYWTKCEDGQYVRVAIANSDGSQFSWELVKNTEAFNLIPE
jgi:hypothetical protein